MKNSIFTKVEFTDTKMHGNRNPQDITIIGANGFTRTIPARTKLQ